MATVAALSTSGLVKIALPEIVQVVTICADGDKAGKQAAKKAMYQFKKQERYVKQINAPDGFDWLDILNGKN